MVVEERSAGAVVYYPGRPVEYLLLHYPAGHWDFPKGNIEEGESPEETALREVREETGLTVRLVPGFSEKVTYFYVRRGVRVRKTVVFFLAEAPSKDVTISWEHRGYVWLPFHLAVERLTYRASRDVLWKANSFLVLTGRAG